MCNSKTGPKRALFNTVRDVGGVVEADGTSALPRNTRQAYYEKQKSTGGSNSGTTYKNTLFKVKGTDHSLSFLRPVMICMTKDTGRKNGFTRVANLEQILCKCDICSALFTFAT